MKPCPSVDTCLVNSYACLTKSCNEYKTPGKDLVLADLSCWENCCVWSEKKFLNVFI